MKDYYYILGVSPQASKDEIKKAYRKLARELHPDTTGDADREEFLKIKEAFDVLSDSKKREDYNRSCREENQAENLHRNVESRPFEANKTTFDEFFQNFYPGSSRGRRTQYSNCRIEEGAAIEILLSPEEARQGGNININIPVNCVCEECGGSGHHFPFICHSCFGEGVIHRQKNVSFIIPKNVRNGDIDSIDLRNYGIHGTLKVYYEVNY